MCEELCSLDEWKRGYYNDWRDMKYHKGKTFLAPPRLFRKDKALYFPNLFGRALDRPGKPRDISPTLKGKVSIVSVYSSVWAQEQADSFTSQKSNPDFHEILKESQGKAQHVVINFSHSRLKALLVRFFMWSIRRSLPKEQHWRYFLVTKGFKRYIGQAIGMSNMSVGHTYLLDRDCKIRWAANAYAQPDEVESLNKGVRRLIAEKDITPSIPGKRKRS
ncbi:Mitochondrial ATPase complex subunit atp10 [Ascosphaera atra]|nr:Mitochondrial ATPase complex subunit atp10 [Ascosphaera atra]